MSSSPSAAPVKSTITRLPSCLTLAGVAGSESCTTTRPAPSGERRKSTPVIAREADGATARFGADEAVCAPAWPPIVTSTLSPSATAV